MVSRTRAEKFKRFADAGTFVPYQDMERRSSRDIDRCRIGTPVVVHKKEM
jgi:hypothetical protein